MDYTVFKASAPGSLMLMGEHAVLDDKLALCVAVGQSVNVMLKPRNDDQIHITSDVFSPYQTTLSQLALIPPYDFVLGVLLAYRDNLTSGCDLAIDADFLPTLGLGSSAALTVASVAVIRQWLEHSFHLPTIMHSARQIVRHVQGCASGADVAASTFGKIVAYRQFDIEPVVLEQIPALTAVYCGYKTPTPQVITRVKKYYENRAEKLNRLFDEIDACTTAALTNWQAGDWESVGHFMNLHFKLQQQLGVSDVALNHIVGKLQQQKNCYGAKISGSGLGDCAIALGQPEPGLFPDSTLMDARQFKVKYSNTGVVLHDTVY
ncbi:MAG: hypothetical protein HKM04_04090 [Legionellales bacterium]|nr:hypothetical protein [Legionellales bacterium]